MSKYGMKDRYRKWNGKRFHLKVEEVTKGRADEVKPFYQKRGALVRITKRAPNKYDVWVHYK